MEPIPEVTDLTNDTVMCNSYVLQLSTGSTMSCSTKLTSLSGLSSLERSFQTNRHLEDLAQFTVPKARKGCCRQCLSRLWMRCSRKHNPVTSQSSVCQRVRYTFLCPPHGPVSSTLTFLLCLFLTWTSLWSLAGPAALPGGHIFSLVFILTLSHVTGQLLSFINVPPLIGMLLVSCLSVNTPVFEYIERPHQQVTSFLRSLAVVVLLVRSGLGFEPASIRRVHPVLLLRLACLPCLTEMLLISVSSYLLLHLPWSASLLLGCVLASVSEPILRPVLTSLQERGYGNREGVTSVLLAAATIDNILVIIIFSLTLAVYLSQGDITLKILHGPMETGVGIFYGIIMGIMLCLVPESKHKHILLLRTVLLLLTGSAAIFASRTLTIPGGAVIACFLSAFTAGLGWRRFQNQHFIFRMQRVLDFLWKLCEPLLYCLLGLEVQLKNTSASSLGLLVAVILLGVAARYVVTLLSLCNTRLAGREKLFISFAWIPKATLQAALASVLLDSASSPADSHVQYIILGCALAILLTTPSGGAVIKLAGPHLLRHTVSEVLDIGEEDALSADLTWDDHLDFDTELTKTIIDLSKPREIVKERETVT